MIQGKLALAHAVRPHTKNVGLATKWRFITLTHAGAFKDKKKRQQV